MVTSCSSVISSALRYFSSSGLNTKPRYRFLRFSIAAANRCLTFAADRRTSSGVAFLSSRLPGVAPVLVARLPCFQISRLRCSRQPIMGISSVQRQKRAVASSALARTNQSRSVEIDDFHDVQNEESGALANSRTSRFKPYAPATRARRAPYPKAA